MSLWQRLLAHEGDAVYVGDQVYSYAELRALSTTLASQLGGERSLVLLLADNSL